MLSEITIKILLTPDAQITVEQEGQADPYEIPPPPLPAAEEYPSDFPPPGELEDFEEAIPPVPEQ